MKLEKSFVLMVATLLLAAAIFALDLRMPVGAGEFILYLLPMLLTVGVAQKSYPMIFAALCSVLAVIGFFFPFVPETPHEVELAIIRRTVGIVVLWATAAFIVQRKRSEAALRASEDRFSGFINNTAAVAWMKDENFRFVFVNKTFESFFQKKLADIKGKTDFDLWPKPVAEQLRAHDTTVLTTWKSLEVTEAVPTPDGKLHQWLVYKFPFADAEGRKFFCGMAMDVTARKVAEEELRNSELRFRSVWQNSADGMRLTDKDGHIVAVNQTFCKLVGMKEQEMIGHPLTVTYHRQDGSMVDRYRERFHTRKIDTHLERRVTFRNGNTVDLEVGNSIVELEREPTLLLSIFRDISERKNHERQSLALERKLLDGQKLESLGVLAGGIAHDFNNLLTGILGNAGLSLMQVSDVSPVRPYLINIEKICLQAADLCKQMLAYSGRGRFVVQKLNLNTVVEEMTQLLRISIAKKVILKFDLAQNLPAIEADSAQIRQVLMNLIINASEAIGDRSGVISIRTGVMRADRQYLGETYLAPDLPEGDYVYIEVADSGCGMNAETKAKIFDPFFTTKFTGRGLGLAAVLGIVRGHKGSLKVYSEVGRGSTFKFLLPCATGPQEAAQQQTQMPGDWRGQGIVLVIDDEESVRTVTARMLELFGFTVLLTADGREGVEVFRAQQEKINCVLLDMTMPHLNGDEAFREIRRMRPEVPVLLISGYNEQDLASRFIGKGLDGFLQKPFKPEELREKLRGILDRK